VKTVFREVKSQRDGALGVLSNVYVSRYP